MAREAPSSDPSNSMVMDSKTDAGDAASPKKHAAGAQNVGNVNITGHSFTGTNVTLTWESPDATLYKLAGYNIYRRPEGGSFSSTPTAFTGTDTTYTDSRLKAGQTYYYKITARDYNRGEHDTSQVYSVTTPSGNQGYTSYVNLKTAVVLYKYTNDRRNSGDYQMSSGEVEDIKKLLKRARMFYWRNTNMRLNLEFDYIHVEEYKDFSDEGYASSTRLTGDHLENDFGVVNTQYDIVFRINPGFGGFWSWGATNLLELPGPDRRTGFSQVHWPLGRKGRFNKYPDEFPNVSVGYQLTWLFIHEGQHAIDGIYNHNDHPEMGHGDFPQLYSVTDIQNSNINCCYPGFPERYTDRFGKRFDFQATMLRDFAAYDGLKSDWGDIYRAKDADGDGFPDEDSRVPMSEKDFASSASSADSDGDGYSDKQEATDGIFVYSTSNPNNADTDGDGVIDGNDRYPRYPLPKTVSNVENGNVPIVDGQINEWSASNMIVNSVTKVTSDQSYSPNVYMTKGKDSLYVALALPDYGIPTIKWDFSGDGRWFGSGNTDMVLNVDNSSFKTLKTWDGSEAARDLDEQIHNKKDGVGNGLWDTNNSYQKNFDGKVFTKDDINLKITSNSSGYHIEMAIPRNSDADFGLNGGEDIGFLVDYSQIFNQNGEHATTFDQTSYQYVQFTNTAPHMASVESPAEGAHVKIEGEPGETVTFRWDQAGDPDGDPVTYNWKLSAGSDFGASDIMLDKSRDETGSLSVNYRTLNRALMNQNVAIGETLKVYHRVNASDAKKTTTGDVSSFYLVRGQVGQKVMAQFIHNAPGLKNVDIYLDDRGERVLDSLSYREASSYIEVFAGKDRDLYLPETGNKPGEQVTTTLDFELETNHQVVIHRDSSITVHKSTGRKLPSGDVTDVRASVIHGTPDRLPDANFQIVEDKEDAPLIASFQDNMNYGQFSDYITFAPSRVAFKAEDNARRFSFELSEAHQTVLTFVTSPKTDSSSTGVTSTYTVRAYDSEGTSYHPVTVTSTSQEKEQLPGELVLHGNYPNPFNPSTTISYSVPEARHVTLRVFNMLGQEVANLVNEKVSAGRHQVTFHAGNLTSGVYVYRIKTRSQSVTKKMMLMK